MSRMHTGLALGVVLVAAWMPCWRTAGNEREDAPASDKKGLRIHEWGVLLRQGCYIGKAAGGNGAEPPAFFQRFPLPPSGFSFQDLAEKPVLHIYVTEPTPLTVTVRFGRKGNPTLAWPPAEVKNSLGYTLTWKLQAGAKSPQPPGVPSGHWVEAARKVGASRLICGKDAEDFLFYEGSIEVPCGCTIFKGLNGNYCTSFDMIGLGPEEAWYLEDGKGIHIPDGRATPERPRPQAFEIKPSELKTLNVLALRTQLAAALARAGLSEKEAGVLLDLWMPEFVKPGKRLIYVMPREIYDGLFPINVTPRPEELQRVGLVVDTVIP